LNFASAIAILLKIIRTFSSSVLIFSYKLLKP